MELAELDHADAHAAEIGDLVAHFVQHQADLALESLAENDAQAQALELLDFLHLRPATLDMETAQQFLAMLGIERLIDADLVLLVDLVPWMGQREGKIAVIRDDEHSFAVLVEAPDMKDARPAGGQKFVDGLAVVLIIRGDDITARLVENSVNGGLRADDAISDLDHILGVHLSGQILHEMPIDPHAAAADELLHISAGAQSSGGKITI